MKPPIDLGPALSGRQKQLITTAILLLNSESNAEAIDMAWCSTSLIDHFSVVGVFAKKPAPENVAQSFQLPYFVCIREKGVRLLDVVIIPEFTFVTFTFESGQWQDRFYSAGSERLHGQLQ